MITDDRCTGGQTPLRSVPKPLTVGEHLDQRIASAREKLEAACVAKAKADAMGWLAYPINDFASIVYPDGPF